jgi:hypothetical protein
MDWQTCALGTFFASICDQRGGIRSVLTNVSLRLLISVSLCLGLADHGAELIFKSRLLDSFLSHGSLRTAQREGEGVGGRGFSTPFLYLSLLA